MWIIWIMILIRRYGMRIRLNYTFIDYLSIERKKERRKNKRNFNTLLVSSVLPVF